MKIILLIFVLLYCIACQNDSKDTCKLVDKSNFEDSIKPKDVNDKKLFHTLIDSAIFYGDAKLYNSLATNQIIYNIRGGEFFLYAFMMANRNNNPEAYYDLYLIIVLNSPGGIKNAIKNLDNETKNFALYFLVKSYEMGYKRAKYSIDEVFGENAVIPKSSHYLLELAKE